MRRARPRSFRCRPTAVPATAALVLAIAACTGTGQPPGDIAPDSQTSISGTEAVGTVATTAAPSPATTAGFPAQADDGVERPCAPDGGSGPSQAARRLTSGDHEYEYLMYVPASASGSVPAPLVVNFHGLGGDGPGQAAYTGYADLADDEGFVVVHPSGLGDNDWGGVRSWELAHSDTSSRDDVQFVRDLIDRVTEQACVDESRVYATGFSNGGYFSAYLACKLADRIAATFSVGGISHPDGCQPSRAVAMGAVHGTDDDVVPFDDSRESVLLRGVQIDDEKARELEAFFAEIIPDELAEFAASFGCSVVTESGHNAVTSLTSYTGCDDGVELRFYAIEGLGHVWPGSPWGKGSQKNSPVAAEGISATAVGWAFMSQYSLNR